MSEAEVAASTPVAETFSKEYVDALKAQLEAKTASELNYKNKYASVENRQRSQLAEMQPIVKDWISEGMEAGAEFKHEMLPMESFGTNLHEAANLDSTFPLARMISCHSAKIKREREEFAAKNGAVEELGKANKEIDTLKEENTTQKARITELEGLTGELRSTSELLQDKLSKAGLVEQKFDFSNASSRESAPQGTTSPAVAAKAPAGASIDPLFAFVSRGGGGGSGRIGLSATGHHILGAAGGASGEADITAALRFA